MNRDMQFLLDSKELARIDRRQHLASIAQLQRDLLATREQIARGRQVIDNRMIYFAIRRQIKRSSRWVEQCGARIARTEKAMRELS
jgi:hypothetical protein